jgi:hypothetical protein
LTEKSPPLDREQWLSLVLALPSHRSSNAGQHEFGTRLIGYVFERLPQRYASDPVATSYFDHVLAEVAWAMRSFSVIRDSYEGAVTVRDSARDIELDLAKSLRQLAPLTSGSLWGRAKGALIGVGLMTPLLVPASTWLQHLPYGPALGIAFVSVLGLFLMEFWVQFFVAKRLKSILGRRPSETDAIWRSTALRQYKLVAKDFIRKVVSIEEKFSYCTTNDAVSATADESLDLMLARAFTILTSSATS